VSKPPSKPAKCESARQALLEKALQRIEKGEATPDVLQELSFKLSQQMMHGPTKALQTAMREQQSESLSLLADALNLGGSSPKKQE